MELVGSLKPLKILIHEESALRAKSGKFSYAKKSDDYSLEFHDLF